MNSSFTSLWSQFVRTFTSKRRHNCRARQRRLRIDQIENIARFEMIFQQNINIGVRMSNERTATACETVFIVCNDNILLCCVSTSVCSRWCYDVNEQTGHWRHIFTLRQLDNVWRSICMGNEMVESLSFPSSDCLTRNAHCVVHRTQWNARYDLVSLPIVNYWRISVLYLCICWEHVANYPRFFNSRHSITQENFNSFE